MVTDMQRQTGTISAGAHPGSYNGQDAYNDMLVVENGSNINAQTIFPPGSTDGVCCKPDSVGLQRSTDCNNFEGGCNVETVVRRLTPLECERLQGMPDDWSRWGVNEKGDVFELSDSARYRLQGNGICTPFWMWLMKRISAQYERPATLGSLFDGQASFPMIWEQINGKGSAVWSSEIEKNAIAVAKYHFPEEEGE